MFLKQSTASQEILLGPFLDDTDGKTAETGLTIANTDIKIWKSGGTTESNKNSGGATHIASGRYYAVLDATDTSTVGLLEVSVSVSGALPVRRQFYVLEEAVYDALFGASAAGYQVPIWSSASATVNLSGTTVKAVTDRVTANTDQIAGSSVSTSTAQIGVNVVQAGGTAWGSGAITAGAIASNAITSAKLATDCITSAQLASTAITEIQSGLATTANVAAVETDTQDIQSRLPAALVSGRMDSSVGAMEPNTITSSVIATGAITASSIQTNAITDDKIAASAITEIQSGLATTTQLTTVEGKIDAIDGVTDKLDTTLELDGVVYRFTTNALEQAPSGGGGGTGTGARTVTITVDDGTNPLQNARVRVVNGAEDYVTSTNASGVAVFNLDDATWTVSISKPGYSFAGASLVVDGTENVTYSMTQVVITPSSVDKVTGYWTVLDETGTAAASVAITIKARQSTRASTGLVHDAAERTATSDANGLVQFTNMIPGWSYALVANDQYIADFTVPADAVTSVELGSIVARLP
jgi:hypothetical protein